MDDTEFYSKVNKNQFDAGVKALTSDVLANLLKLMMLTGNGMKQFTNTRGMMTYAMKKLVDSMLEEVMSAFKDADNFIETGNIPDYMKSADQEMLRRIRDMIRDRKGYPE